MKTIREKIQTIIEAHKDKTPETLAAMIFAYLYQDQVISSCCPEEDDLYYDTEGECLNDRITEDYEDIGIDLFF